jgi:DNA-binding IclR family transcriptional regulator
VAKVWREAAPTVKGRTEVLEALDALGGTAKLTDLARATEKAPPTVLDLLHGLADNGLVRQDAARGPWMLLQNHG